MQMEGIAAVAIHTVKVRHFSPISVLDSNGERDDDDDDYDGVSPSNLLLKSLNNLNYLLARRNHFEFFFLLRQK